MREWLVASGIVEGPEGILLVANRRRGRQAVDWSPPGGVVEPGELLVDGLTREVREETGITVRAWEGPIWEVEATSEDMDYHVRVEVHRALSWEGEIVVDDPDGIVIDAIFVPVERCVTQLSGTWLPTREPLAAWIDERWTTPRSYRYQVHGKSPADMTVLRL